MSLKEERDAEILAFQVAHNSRDNKNIFIVLNVYLFIKVCAEVQFVWVSVWRAIFPYKLKELSIMCNVII